MYSMRIFVGLLLQFSLCSSLRFASYFQDRMVLQREPTKPTIHGFDQLLPGTQAHLTCSFKGDSLGTKKLFPTALKGKTADGTWMVELPPQVGGTVCDIAVAVGAEVLVLNEVVFGDVWLCSGQSNMVFTMGGILNSSAEIAASTGYKDIRMTRMPQLTSDHETEDIAPWMPWTDPSHSKWLPKMSAVCFLFARKLYDELGIPVGLIDSAWGGTRVEAWSTPAGLEACNVPDHVDEGHAQQSNSYLWNAMIAPLRKNAVKGFLWYQGEANSGWNRDLYNCTFPTLIDTWRQEFSANSDTDPNAPFGFVQLSTIKGSHSLAYPIIRWHQTADYGVVPNERLKNVFMAVAIDTYDEENGIHPRNKQIVGERLFYAGMNVAYGDTSFPANGPVPVKSDIHRESLRLVYDVPISYDQSEISGFYFCCLSFEACGESTLDTDWPEIEPQYVSLNHSHKTILIDNEFLSSACGEDTAPALAYLWRETPVKGMLAAPIYSDDEFRMPAAEWKMPGSAHFSNS